MIMNAMHRIERYTYRDYCLWDDGQRWELIDGVPYAMAAPSPAHQRASRKLVRKFDEHLDGKNCEVFYAPLDVRLNADKADDTVVQPDILVICDPSMLSDNKSCKGAPDLVIEILSPSNARHDRVVKFAKYREAGVQEVWFVDAETGDVEVCKRLGGEYTTNFYGLTDSITVGILPELTIDLNTIFEANTLESVSQENT